jgi:hypothetical protein
MSSSFSIGDQVETNQEYKNTILRMNKQYKSNHPKYVMGTIIKIVEYLTLPTSILLDNGYWVYEEHIKEMV